MNNDETILAAIDPELMDDLVTRRDVLKRSTTVAAALALGSVPVALAVLTKEAHAQSTDVTSVLNFALALEIFPATISALTLSSTILVLRPTAIVCRTGER